MILSIISYVLVVIFTKTTFVSTYGWYMIIEIAFIFALGIDYYDNEELFKGIVISTYSVIVVAILMLLIMLSGDGIDLSFDGFGVSDLSSPREKRRKQVP